jgi:putative Ca2+/H+ antiporter (TMEM165/GDT1 family)
LSPLLISFFVVAIAEIGDKTQLATAALAAQFHPLMAVVAGTTFGMMAANIPAVLMSHALAGRIPLKLVRALWEWYLPG